MNKTDVVLKQEETRKRILDTFKTSKNKSYRNLVIFISSMSLKYGRSVPNLIELFDSCNSVLSDKTQLHIELISREELKLYKSTFNEKLKAYLDSRKELML